MTPYQKAERAAQNKNSSARYFTSVLKAQFNQQAINLRTVNVMEIIEDIPQSLRSFADNSKGNKRAEGLFRQLIINVMPSHQTLTDDDFSDFLDDGMWEDGMGYAIFITHST